MKVVVLASQKGGAGKTTLAAHLAVAADAAGAGPVVLIDTDPQGSLSEWWNGRQAETPLFVAPPLEQLAAELDRLREAGAKLVVIDTPPAMSAAIGAVIRLADLVVIPVRPSPHDLRAVGHTVELVEQVGKPFIFTITQAKAAAKLTSQAAAVLSGHGPVAPAIIGDRVDFAASMIDGRTVAELLPRGPSAAEIAELWNFVSLRLVSKVKRAHMHAS